MFAFDLLRPAAIVALGACSLGAVLFDGADEVAQIFRDVVELRSSSEDGLERLKRIPRDVAIPAVVAQLSTPEVDKLGAARSIGYQALAHPRAGSAPEAREVLLGCLSERNAAVAAPCAQTLPADVLQAFVGEQALCLRAPGMDESSKLLAIIRLANLTPFVAEAFAPLAECYADATQAGPERSIALRGMLWSGRLRFAPPAGRTSGRVL